MHVPSVIEGFRRRREEKRLLHEKMLEVERLPLQDGHSADDRSDAQARVGLIDG